MANKTQAEWLTRPGDSEETRKEIAELLARGFRVSRPDQYQLKIACFNYYPNKGTLTIDPWRRSNSLEELRAKGTTHARRPLRGTLYPNPRRL